jgi:hypothetical protein
MPDNQTPIERVALTDGKDTEDLWYPWDFLHFRRMFRLRQSEHGEPVFDEAQGIYKKLKLAIDQMVVHRAQVQPDRYAINIDTKESPPAEQAKIVQRWKQSMRAKLAFGQQWNQAGLSNQFNSPVGFDSFYNAWSLDTILWVARPTGFNHVVEKLQGTQNVPDVYDIELLTDLFYSIIGMPRSWFSAKGGDGGGGDQAPSGKALLAQDMRFLRKIKSIRRPLINVYTWLGYFHAVLLGKDIRQLDIRAMMPPIGGLEEQMKLEMLKVQAEVLGMMADVMDQYALPKEAWVEIIFKKYLHLPDDIVNIFITALPSEEDPVPVESLQRKPAPYSYKLIRQIQEKVGKDPQVGRLLEDLRTVIYGEDERRAIKMSMHRWKKLDEVCGVPKMKDFDVIVSSYGRHPFELKRLSGEGGAEKYQGTTKTALQETLRETEPQAESAGGPDAYRRWMPI